MAGRVKTDASRHSTRNYYFLYKMDSGGHAT